MRKALEGVLVLDLTRVLAGPYCGMLLGDLGADVIKIEEPKRGDMVRANKPDVNGESGYFMALNRNKKGITLNLKEPEAKEIFLSLVRKADVVIENYRPGVMDKLGLGYSVLKEINPRIIYGCISGFGQTGPYRDYAGFDIIGQAMSGMMSTTGWPGTPPTRTGAPIGDTEAGMNCAIGILAALYNREFTGLGQQVDIALVDSMVSSLITINMRYLNGNLLPERTGNRYENSYPYDSFKTKDGYAVLAAPYDNLWAKVCKRMGRPECATAPGMDTLDHRITNHKKIKEIIEEWSTTITTDEFVRVLQEEGLAVSPILTLDQVAEDPHICGARNMFVEIDHPVAGKVRITNDAIKLSDTPTTVRFPSPTLGQHNEEILSNMLGYSPDKIADLKTRGVI